MLPHIHAFKQTTSLHCGNAWKLFSAMLHIMLRCFARGFFSLLNHNEKTSCQNHTRYKLGKVRKGLIKFGENTIDPAKALDTCQKFGEEKRCPTVTWIKIQSMQKRAFLPFLMRLRPSVWLGFVSRWKPAAGKPAQREKARIFLIH